jgi:hypothetical protein
MLAKLLRIVVDDHPQHFFITEWFFHQSGGIILTTTQLTGVDVTYSYVQNVKGYIAFAPNQWSQLSVREVEIES